MPRLTKQELLNRKPEIEKDKQDVFLSLRPRTLRFFLNYLEMFGNTTEAYMKSHRTKDRNKARVLGNKLLRLHPEVKRALYDMWGFDEGSIITTLREAKQANRQQIYRGVVHEFPDHYARLKALEMANKFKESADNDTEKSGSKVQILIVNDTNKGVFRVEDNS